MTRLCLLDDNGATAQAWEIGDQPLAVGRGAGADVVIDDAALSRVHFKISREGERFVLTDMSSQNGTWVDGERAAATALHHHDCILAGRSLFIFSDSRLQAGGGSSA
jgi:pSer/pThr/pTyr-binding forkhead associated (FHA) protein